MGRRSSVRWDFVHVKTAGGLETSVRFFVKIFSEGRQQGFSAVHKVSHNQQKNSKCSKLNIYLRISVKIFFQKDVGRKKCIIAQQQFAVCGSSYAYNDA